MPGLTTAQVSSVSLVHVPELISQVTELSALNVCVEA